jgi:hypothetical protein
MAEAGENTDCQSYRVLVYAGTAPKRRKSTNSAAAIITDTYMAYRVTGTLGQDVDTLAQRYEQTMVRLEQITGRL